MAVASIGLLNNAECSRGENRWDRFTKYEGSPKKFQRPSRDRGNAYGTRTRDLCLERANLTFCLELDQVDLVSINLALQIYYACKGLYRLAPVGTD